MELRYSKHTDGIYYYRVPIHGTLRHKWVSTGARTMPEARQVVADSGADRLVLNHHAQTLTHDTVAIITQGRRITSAEVLAGCIEWLDRRVSNSTRVRYVAELVALMRNTDCEHKPLTVLSERQLDDWVNTPGIALNTANIRLHSLRWLYRYASGHAYVLGNISLLVDVNRRIMAVDKLEPKHFEPLSDEDYQKLLASIPPDNFWHAAAILGYCTGLRMSDCCMMEWASFNTEEITVFTRKNNRKRLALPLSDPLIHRPELAALIARLNDLPREPDQPYVWPKIALTYMAMNGPPNLSTRFRERLIKAGIVGKSFHCLRTAFARRLQAAGRTLEQIARNMGHANTATTEIYVGEAK